MKKSTLTLVALFNFCFLQAQTDNVWKLFNKKENKLKTEKSVSRLSFPKEYSLFELEISPLRSLLFSIVGKNSIKHNTIISLPNADGQLDLFEVTEASNFEKELQAQFPEIRAFSGKGITDKTACLKLSISPQGIQTMVFRAGKESEFIEPYSIDHKVYVVYKSQRAKGDIPWTCATEDKELTKNLTSKLSFTNRSSAGELKTMRLALSCNAEYANYFGANTSNQFTTGPGLVLAAFNATLTRCNGVFEKDLGVHLNLVAASTNVIFYNPDTDPYTDMDFWNSELQNTLSSKLTGPNSTLTQNNAAYDIGHLFGSTGGGGNAGCIGCVCSDDTADLTDENKGSGYTSPADGVPQGDNFDIDYVAHEIGHQLGAHHTFSFAIHNNYSCKEVGSGITIMGYAGITPYDVANHSIPFFHYTSIQQIQENLATKSCLVTENITSNNATPIVNAGNDYIIPKETPFKLTGISSDANTNDILTYSWEQSDNVISSTASNSNATSTKTEGPTFISTIPTATPARYFPKLETIMSNSLKTPTITGDVGMNLESLSSVARNLNFRLTVRDNAIYSSNTPKRVGQTAFDDMVVTVRNTTAFTVTSQATTGISYQGGSTQTISWIKGNTQLSPINVSNVKITLSANNGVDDFPYVLSASTLNDGSEAVVIPNNINSSNCRIKVEAIGNIFFNVNTAKFSIISNSYTDLSTNDFEFPDFTLFPNPNKGSFTLKFTPVSNDNIEVEIHDIRGREVFKNLYRNEDFFNKKINLNAVESGIYFINISNGQFKSVHRLVIE